MRQISLQKKLTIFISTIVFGMTLILLGIVWPSYKHIAELKNSIGNIESYLEEQYLKTKHIQRSIRQMDNILAQTKKFKNTTVPIGHELEIITQLEKIAADHQIQQKLDVSLVKPVETTAKDTAPTSAARQMSTHYRFSFINEGYFENHVNYFKDLESLSYYFIIDSVRWEKKQADQADSTITPVTLKFNAIVYADP